jgi:hypothetical protein
MDATLQANELEAELVSVSRRARELEAQLGESGPDMGRAALNLQHDVRRIRKLGVNAKLRDHASLDPTAKARASDPRREALEGLLLP